MRIAVLGAGNVGAALARGWSRSGHQITFGLRDIARHRDLLAETGARAMSLNDAASDAEVVVLALPWGAAEGVLRGLGDLSGKIVIDAMNPITRGASGPSLALGHTTSGGEQVAGWLPGARVIKTLNQCGAEVMGDNSAMAHRPVMIMAGDDVDAKRTVAALLLDLGFDPLDAGDLTKARLIEPFAMVWINLAAFRGKGRNWAFAAVSNPKA
jgi:8-hydroxy-5-deazaflavin:NADPH oxidoreductase